MYLNETLKQYWFTQEQLDELELLTIQRVSRYWDAAYHFVVTISLLPLPLSEKQEGWLRRIQKDLALDKPDKT